MATHQPLFGENITKHVTLTGDHEVSFTGPTAPEGEVTRMVELTVLDNTIADGDIPTASGWAHENNDEDKSIYINRCDEDTTNDEMTIGYHGTPVGDPAYDFVIDISDPIKGTLTTCTGSGGSGGGGSGVREFTLVIKQEDTIAIKPNPACVAVSTDEDRWVKLTAYTYVWTDSETHGN